MKTWIIGFLFLAACGDNIKPYEPDTDIDDIGDDFEIDDKRPDLDDVLEIEPDAGVVTPDAPVECDDGDDLNCHWHNGHWHCEKGDHEHNGKWHHGHL